MIWSYDFIRFPLFPRQNRSGIIKLWLVPSLCCLHSRQQIKTKTHKELLTKHQARRKLRQWRVKSDSMSEKMPIEWRWKKITNGIRWCNFALVWLKLSKYLTSDNIECYNVVASDGRFPISVRTCAKAALLFVFQYRLVYVFDGNLCVLICLFFLFERPA